MAKFYKTPLIKPYFPRSALSGDNLEFWIGREEQIDRVVRGLLASNAHYLITGYPGVGKSSFVSRVIAEWRKLSADHNINRVLIFNLHFAQPQSPEEVVKRLIGKVYFGSLDGQYSPTKKLAERLQLNYIQAYAKTLKETQAETATSSSGIEATVNLPNTLTIAGGNLGRSLKKSKEVSKSLEIQKEYNLNVATSDFESILHLLTQSESFRSGWLERLKKWIFRSGDNVHSSRILFVFDQMDDLKFVQELSGFFNLPNASFIVLGGIKLQDQIALAKEQGTHALDNFDEVYLGCQWNKAQDMLSLLIDPKRISPRKYADYTDYLNFCSQGLPRRLFAAIDQHIKRDQNQFYLGLSPSEQKRIKLCAELHRILWKHRKDILGSHIDNVQHPRRDKSLRGAYHLTDLIFRVAKFSFDDVHTVATQISEVMIHPRRERVLRNLLKTFEDYKLLVKDGNIYRLSENVLNMVKHIPDWLKDGYVDAHEFIHEVQKFEERESPSILDIRLPRKNQQQSPKKERPQFETKRTLTPGEEPEQETFADTDFTAETLSERVELSLGGHDLKGTTLDGRYFIEKELGRGGVGVVYLARDQKLLGRRVVVKVLLEKSLQNQWALLKFRQEIEALTRVDRHPGIVSILDAGETPDGIPYIIMQYVQGVTLRKVLQGEGMELERVAYIIEQATSALSEAHDEGILHRDLKPENIMLETLGSREQVKIIDFGIAKVRDSMVGPSTILGMHGGTVLYMSPEQLQGQMLTPASDIYALGLIAYEMLTGRRAFNPETPFQLLEMQRRGIRILPRELRPELSEATQDVILKALNFNNSMRYQRAIDFGKDLERRLYENFSS